MNWIDGAPTEPGRYVVQYPNGFETYYRYTNDPDDDVVKHYPIPDPDPPAELPAELPVPKVFRAKLMDGTSVVGVEFDGYRNVAVQLRDASCPPQFVSRGSLTDVHPIPNPLRVWAEKHSVRQILKDAVGGCLESKWTASCLDAAADELETLLATED